MKKLLILSCSVFLVICSVQAEDATTQPDPALLKAEQTIRKVLADIDPEATFEYPEHTQTLLVKYRPRKFMIHGGSKIGKYDEKAHEEEGPDYMGFILRLHLQEAGTVNQAVVPQTIRASYWNTDLNITTVKGTDKQLYWGLSYGNRTDAELLDKLRSSIASLENKANQRVDFTRVNE